MDGLISKQIKKTVDSFQKMLYNISMTKNKKIKTVKFVNNKDSERAALFESIIDELENYELVDDSYEGTPTYNIIFNLTDKAKDEADAIANLSVLAETEETYSIFDISEEEFLESPLNDFFLLFAAAASFVTCSSEFIQEHLYDHTGRVAYLVPNPVTEDIFVEPSFTPSFGSPTIYWYGETKDIMSVRPYITRNVHNIKIATTGSVSFTNDRAKTFVITSEKRKKKILENADIVFLPPTHTVNGEIRRFRKIEEAIMLGKYVIAPDCSFDFDNLASPATLEEGLKFFGNLQDKDGYTEARQQLLLNKYSKDAVKNSLLTAFELVPEDYYQEEVDFLVSEYIYI